MGITRFTTPARYVFSADWPTAIGLGILAVFSWQRARKEPIEALPRLS
jgi:hypothetical protein